MILLSLNRTNERSKDVVEGVEYLRQLMTAPQFAPSRSAKCCERTDFASLPVMHRYHINVTATSRNGYFGTDVASKTSKPALISKTVAEPGPDG